MTTKRKLIPTPVPSVRTMAGALLALRKVMKDDHGLDVDVDVKLYKWPATSHLARLAVADMAEDGGATWTSERRQAFGNEKLDFFYMKSAGPDKGLEVTIFKSEGERLGKKRKLLKNPPLTISKAAWAALRICTLSQELYGADADVEVVTKVEVSRYPFSTPINPHVTPEVATEVLGEVAAGTKWGQSESISTYYSKTDLHRYKLSGEGIKFEIRMELPKKEVDVLEDVKD